MKNKKLLTRLFALLASLVLVLALALPCFADVEEGDETYVIDSITFTDRASLYDWLSVNYMSVVDCFITATAFDPLIRCDNVVALNGGEFAFYYSEIWWNEVEGDVFIADPSFTVFLVNNDLTTILFDASISGGHGNATHLTDMAWPQLAISVTFTYLSPIENSGGSTDPTSPSSDMYSNLFNILKDAVYGSDAELTGSQEYALTLISTILTYATILLPVILVICIAVWCFKRF